MNVLDLFSGIGGFSLGLERAGMKTIAFCEIDKKAQLVLKKHWPDVPIFEDVSTLKKEDIHEQVDVICGGFPCQDISVAGRGAGLEGARSGLWYEFHRLIKEIRPRYAIIENVSALRSRGLDKILGSLAEIGYDAEWHCIPASAVGAPHQRDRIWILAYPQCEREGRRGIQRPRKDLEAMASGSSNQFVGASEALANTNSTSGLDVFRKQLDGEEQREPCLSSTPLSHANDRWLEWRKQWVEGGEENGDTGFKRKWPVEPNVGRVAHGIPNRVDRLKQLGNAVVPQIPELIGNMVMKHHVKIPQEKTNHWNHNG
jgi:DNA (cytosine-5)-methyltransferase 1